MNKMLHVENKIHAVRWQSVPPLWEVPPVDFNAVTIENTALMLKLLPDTTDFSTIEVEEFWSRFVALAATNYPGAIQAVQGVSATARNGLVAQWARDPLNFQADVPLSGTVSCARDQQVLENAGSIPCLLSSPTAADLSVDFISFVQRIEEYQYLDIPILVTDLYLALLRIDFRNTSEQLIETTSAHLDVKVQVDSTIFLSINVAQLCHRFQAESVFSTNEATGLDTSDQPVSVFLQKCLDIDPQTLPLVDDVDDHFLQWQQSGGDEAVGLYALQVASRRHPVAPGTLINLLAIQRNTAKGSIPRARAALRLAWERGLLDLWRIDISLLDWSPRLEKIPSLVVALTEIAGEGLLALSWQTLDEILGYAAEYKGRKLGMVEVIRAMEDLLPAVHDAVSNNQAPESVLELPGLRAFAELSGRSKAIVAAKDLISQIAQEPATTTD